MSLLESSRLVRNSVYNLLGQGIPLMAAVVAIPLLIRSLGTERFGVLTLAWMVIGYFSLFDFGLGRALTQVIAERIGAGDDMRAPPLAWTALALMLALGLVGALFVGLLAPWLVRSALKVPGKLQAETLQAFYLLAVAIPIVVVTAGLAGILSAFQRFGVLSAIRAPMGIYMFVAPLAVLPFSQSLAWVTAVLVFGRLLACIAHLAFSLPLMPAPNTGTEWQFSSVKPLFHFGVWMTVTNLVGPLMLYLDRFIIAAMVSVAAVAHYATPYEMVTKLLIVPGAMLGVLFPAFAASYRLDHGRLLQLYVRGTKYIALLLFPVTLLIVAFAREGLQWWLGDEFARASTLILQSLAIGVFINSLAQVLFTLVQGIGRPDLGAKLHLLELLVYLPALWWVVRHHGIDGAAILWTGRVVLDGALLLGLSRRFLSNSTDLLKRLTVGVTIAVAALAAPLLVPGTADRLAVVSLLLASFAVLTWSAALAEDERSSILRWVGWR